MSDPGARDDLGVEAGLRRVKRPYVHRHTPGVGGMVPQFDRKPVVKRYGQQRGSRLPVSGADPERDMMLAAARQLWTCEVCGRENRYYRARCKGKDCDGRRPW